MSESGIALDRLYKLININLTLNDNYSNFEVVLQKLLHAIEIITESETTSLLVYDINREDFVFRFATGRTASDIIGLKVPKGKGIVHLVADSRKGMVINDDEQSKQQYHYTGIDQAINFRTKNLMAFPVLDHNGEVFGVVEVCNKKNGKSYTKGDFQLLSIFCQQAERTIRHTLYIHSLKKGIFSLQKKFEEIKLTPFIYVSREIRNIMNTVKDIAPSNSPILITGEKGTGKTLCAHYIHYFSPRKNKELVVINCYSLCKKYANDITQLRSALWGVVKAKLKKTSAESVKKESTGLFEEARGGTILLEDVESLPLDIQQDLQNFLTQRFYSYVNIGNGSTRPVPLDTRVICTSATDLEKRVEAGTFLESLFFSITSLAVNFTPINSRIDDLQAVAEHYIDHFIMRYNKSIDFIDPKVYVFLKRYEWKNNLHSLINSIESLVLNCETNELGSEYIAAYMYRFLGEDKKEDKLDSTEPIESLKNAVNRFKTRYIYKALLQHQWNHTKTSRTLDIQRSYLSRLVKEYSLKTKNIHGDNDKESETGIPEKKEKSVRKSKSTSRVVAKAAKKNNVSKSVAKKKGAEKKKKTVKKKK